MMKGIFKVEIDGQVIYQQNTIGIPTENENTQNIDEPAVIEL